jgi:hypothetical protein
MQERVQNQNRNKTRPKSNHCHAAKTRTPANVDEPANDMIATGGARLSWESDLGMCHGVILIGA